MDRWAAIRSAAIVAIGSALIPDVPLSEDDVRSIVAASTGPQVSLISPAGPARSSPIIRRLASASRTPTLMFASHALACSDHRERSSHGGSAQHLLLCLPSVADAADSRVTREDALGRCPLSPVRRDEGWHPADDVADLAVRGGVRSALRKQG